ncbi:hypothetical protein [Sphingopyxis sp. BSNA05]|uniref:hypothetical protein n=1 Tax=Sphingopyxis sp. BSNA05 TaxID=1236614 RepID=UPI00349FBB40
MHLSDIHIGVTDPHSDQLHITNSIIRHFEDHEISCDLICFTGDIANAGNSEQLGVAEKFWCGLPNSLEVR